MGGEKGQVALYVLIGVVILLGVVLGIYLLRQRASSDGTETVPEATLSTECEGEQARMQDRADRCLGQSALSVIGEYRELGILPESRSQLVTALEEEIADEFVNCFYEWPINERLTITANEPPEVTAILTDSAITLEAVFAVEGTCEDGSYRIRTYSSTAETDVGAEFDRLDKIRNRITSPSTGFFAADCGVDPYALTDEGIYADVIYLEDGQRIVYLYDYNNYINDPEAAEPQPLAITLPACIPTEETPFGGEE